MATTHVNERVQRHRKALRASGLRPVQIWVPDTRRQGFDAECRRQSALAAKADKADKGLDEFLDEAAHDIDGWSG